MRIPLSLLIFIFIPTSKAMESVVAEPLESLAVITQGCKPLELMSAFWKENKQVICYSTVFLLGGYFIYDWVCRGKQIKQLEDKVQALQMDRTTTTILSEIRRVENRLEIQEKSEDTLNKDLTYLWRYIFTDQKIHDHNMIEREANAYRGPYIDRPQIKWFNGTNIIDLIKKFANYVEPQEFKGEPVHISMPLISPRHHSPPLSRSNSPTNIENGNGKNGNGKHNNGSGNGKKNGRRSPEREKEK